MPSNIYTVYIVTRKSIWSIRIDNSNDRSIDNAIRYLSGILIYRFSIFRKILFDAIRRTSVREAVTSQHHYAPPPFFLLKLPVYHSTMVLRGLRGPSIGFPVCPISTTADIKKFFLQYTQENRISFPLKL